MSARVFDATHLAGLQQRFTVAESVAGGATNKLEGASRDTVRPSPSAAAAAAAPRAAAPPGRAWGGRWQTLLTTRMRRRAPLP